MSMNFCIKADQLRAALKEIEEAEANGFYHCNAVFKMKSFGTMLSECQAEYSDLLEKAHPTDPSLNWGRFQCVSSKNKFINGHLVPIEA